MQFVLGFNRPFDHQENAGAYENIKVKANAIRNSLIQQASWKTWNHRSGFLKNIFYPEGGRAFILRIFSSNVASVLSCSSQGPCHVELHSALEVIASSQQQLGENFTTFYLPNCDKHGYYKAKQVGILVHLLKEIFPKAAALIYSCGFPPFGSPTVWVLSGWTTRSLLVRLLLER